MITLEIGKTYKVKNEKIIYFPAQHGIKSGSERYMYAETIFLILNKVIHARNIDCYEIFYDNKIVFFFINKEYNEDKELDALFEYVI